MSKQGISLLTLTLVATGVIRAARGVGHDGAEATVAGQKIAGVARNAAAVADPLPVDAKGTTFIESGGVIVVGDALTVDNQGRAVAAAALAVADPTINAGATPVTSTAANGDVTTQGAITGGILPQYVFADALQAAGGAGEFIEVLLR